MRRPDLSTLGTGTAVLVLGAFLYLHSKGTLDLDAGASFALLGGCVLVALIARAMGRPSAPAADTGARDTLAIAPALSPETSRASKLGLAVGGLLGVGLIVLWLTGVIEFAGRVALAALVVAIALTLISAPFWRATFNRLGAERVARARADERADVAAHLHDSVLQTLALIQTRSDDPSRSRGSPAARRGSCANGSPTASRAGRTSASPTRSGQPPPTSRTRTALRSRRWSSAMQSSTSGSRRSWRRAGRR